MERVAKDEFKPEYRNLKKFITGLGNGWEGFYDMLLDSKCTKIEGYNSYNRAHKTVESTFKQEYNHEYEE